MSLLALLAAGVPTPVDSAPPPAGGAADALPTLDDARLMTYRPSGQRAGFLRFGPSRQYTTLGAALAAAVGIRDDAIRIAGKTVPANADPFLWAPLRDYRVDIVGDPGTYVEPNGYVDLGPHIAIYAADGQPSSVTIQAGLDPSQGWCYTEGVDFVPPKDGTGAKYASHLANNGTTIYARGTFDTANRAGGLGGDTPIGMDGVNRGALYVYDCDLSGGTYTNLHGWPDTQLTAPETVCFIDTRFPGGTLHYNASNDTIACEVWTVGCTAGNTSIVGAAAKLHVSGSTFTGSGIPSGARSTPDDTSAAYPEPVGGLSPWWRNWLTSNGHAVN